MIIPTYNREKTIAHAIQSALDQSYRNLEVIVVDDGSTDRTAEVLKRFGERIRVIGQANAGPSAARNRGVESALGSIIAFLDSDDAWFPNKLARQVALLERLGPRVSCCLCNIQFAQGPAARNTSFAVADLHPPIEEGVWRNPTEVLITRFVLFNQALAARKDALLEAGLFRRDLRLLEDYDLALRLSMLGPWAFIQTPLVSYGTGESNSLTSSCVSDKTVLPRIALRILELLLASGKLSEGRLRGVLRRQITYSSLRLTAAEWVNGRSESGRVLGRTLDCCLSLFASIQRRTPLLRRMDVVSTDEFLLKGEQLGGG
ncbi:MAG: glycosyltransferase family A protein [Verrucomicrobiota bacterium]